MTEKAIRTVRREFLDALDTLAKGGALYELGAAYSMASDEHTRWDVEDRIVACIKTCAAKKEIDALGDFLESDGIPDALKANAIMACWGCTKNHEITAVRQDVADMLFRKGIAGKMRMLLPESVNEYVEISLRQSYAYDDAEAFSVGMPAGVKLVFLREISMAIDLLIERDHVNELAALIIEKKLLPELTVKALGALGANGGAENIADFLEKRNGEISPNVRGAAEEELVKAVKSRCHRGRGVSVRNLLAREKLPSCVREAGEKALKKLEMERMEKWGAQNRVVNSYLEMRKDGSFKKPGMWRTAFRKVKETMTRQRSLADRVPHAGF